MLLNSTVVFKVRIHCTLMAVASSPAIGYVCVCSQRANRKTQTVQCGAATLLLCANPDFVQCPAAGIKDKDAINGRKLLFSANEKIKSHRDR